MQMDLALGRETGVAWTVGEVVRLGAGQDGVGDE